jgi:hypothetical protein
MKTTVTLTDENVAGLAWAVKLTGLSLEEIVNLLLADELTCFRPDYEDEYVENTLGCWELKDRASAERTLKWVKKKVRGRHRGKYPIFEGAVRELGTGRFQIDAFRTQGNGERERVSEFK